MKKKVSASTPGVNAYRTNVRIVTIWSLAAATCDGRLDAAPRRVPAIAGGRPAGCHPLPMKGILVAVMVRNCTLASRGRLAM